MSEDLENDPSGLPVPPGDGADDPGADAPQLGGDPWAPMDAPSQEPVTDREEILRLVNWCRDLEKQLLELRSLINQADATTGGGFVDARFNPATKFIEFAFESPGVTWIPKIEFKDPCQT